MGHKHLCFTCNKIWECNNTDQVLIFDDGEGNEEYTDCDAIDNYEYQCQECLNARVPNPAFKELEEKLLLLGGTIEYSDGTVDKITKQ